MEHATSNIEMVAVAVEEMNTTINEITTNTSVAKKTTNDAVVRADSVSNRMSELGEAADEIGRVVESITDIYGQVNLLALDATIEAAQAGVAGKGFAVVANEIKELAQQTSEATDEIKGKVGGIQRSTESTISEIKGITGIINTVDDIVTGIAGSIG